MQLRLEEEQENYFNLLWKNAQKALSDNKRLTRLRKQIFVLLIWENYYEHLQKESMNVGEKESASICEMTAPEMFKTLAEIVLLNRKQDSDTIEKIKSILQEWSSKNN